MATVTTPVQSVISNLVLELLNGQLSDETIAAVDGIQRSDVPAPLSDVVGYMHGMTMQPEFREDCINYLLIELSSGIEQLARERRGF
jgi:hypothetical protein